jgi:hypothetical protein
MSGKTTTEAHRAVFFQGKEKRMRTYPLAGDTDNDATYDHEGEAEEAPAAVPPVASSAQNQIQMKLSSFVVPASAGDVARQLSRLTDDDILGFTSSCNTLHYQPVLAKLLCMHTSLTARFEVIRLDDVAAAVWVKSPSKKQACRCYVERVRRLQGPVLVDRAHLQRFEMRASDAVCAEVPP